MKHDVENNEWKTEAPYLASLPAENPFIVPEHYFNSLSDTINAAVYTEKLKEGIPASGFTVPEDYFSSLKARIVTETGLGILQHLPEKDGNSIPDGYFEQLQAKILARTTAETSADLKVVAPIQEKSKIVRLWHSDLLKYASAACFILVTAFGLYLNQQNFTQESTVSDIANEQMLYDIDEQDIIDHIDRNTPEIQRAAVKNEELETYILNNYSQNDLASELN
jgi:hypothetical protein